MTTHWNPSACSSVDVFHSLLLPHDNNWWLKRPNDGLTNAIQVHKADEYSAPEQDTFYWNIIAFASTFAGVFDSIYFCNLYLTYAEQQDLISKPKSAILREINAELLVEDSLEHALECAQVGIPVLLFDREGSYGWNHINIEGKGQQEADAMILPRNVTRIKSWKQVVSHFPKPASPLRFCWVPSDFAASDEESDDLETVNVDDMSDDDQYCSENGDWRQSDSRELIWTWPSFSFLFPAPPLLISQCTNNLLFFLFFYFFPFQKTNIIDTPQLFPPTISANAAVHTLLPYSLFDCILWTPFLFHFHCLNPYLFSSIIILYHCILCCHCIIPN